MNFGHQLSHPHTDAHFHSKRGSGDYSSPQAGPGEMPMTGPPNGHMPISIMPGQGRGTSGYGAGFAAARSPPKSKSTSHVPCKFYPIGQCQAGAACQFSHDLDPTTQNAPCKYFARGSCKFGQSCALMHVMPDGRVLNRPTRGGMQPHGRRGTHNGSMYAGVPTSPLAINTQDPGFPHPDHLAFQNQDPSSAYTHQPTSPIFRAEIHPSNVSSPYGSPHNDFLSTRSPPRPGLSARDAQLPSSWDSQGISQAARHGPYAASVPGRFGLESPPASFPKAQIGNTALRDMRDSAFGDTANLDGVLHGLGSSPRERAEPLTFTKRPLHSERFARQRQPISSSLDVRTSNAFIAEAQNAEEDHSDGAGEDLLPSSLHDLLPTDKPRRSSRSGGTAPGFSDDEGSPWGKRVLSNGNSEQHTKAGSLSPHSASPSRYSSIWSARSSNTHVNKTDPDTAGFGHVGSPLRPSNLRTSSTTSTTSDPPRAASSKGGMSMLTSQLQRAKLSDDGPQQNRAAPTSSPSLGNGRFGANAAPSEGSPTPNQSAGNLVGLGRDKIDEETMFEFDDGEEGEGVMGASQQLGGSVAEPGGANGSSGGAAWLGTSPVGVIGGQRGK